MLTMQQLLREQRRAARARSLQGPLLNAKFGMVVANASDQVRGTPICTTTHLHTTLTKGQRVSEAQAHTLQLLGLRVLARTVQSLDQVNSFICNQGVDALVATAHRSLTASAAAEQQQRAGWAEAEGGWGGGSPLPGGGSAFSSRPGTAGSSRPGTAASAADGDGDGGVSLGGLDPPMLVAASKVGRYEALLTDMRHS
jgi:hypothetical protein